MDLDPFDGIAFLEQLSIVVPARTQYGFLSFCLHLALFHRSSAFYERERKKIWLRGKGDGCVPFQFKRHVESGWEKPEVGPRACGLNVIFQCVYSSRHLLASSYGI